jgi:hypothetical protein
MNAILTRITKDGEDKLALRFSSGAVKGSGPALTSAMSEEGFLIPADSSRIEVWKFDGIAQEGEGASLVGPAFEGASLDDAESLREGMSLLSRVARALVALASGGKLPRGLVSSGILVSKAKTAGAPGAVLILPPAAAAKALSTQGPSSRAAAVARLTSPHSQSPEADASFFLAQAAYRCATGKNAFEREAAEPGNLAGSKRYSLAAVLAAPRLDPALAALIDAALDDPNRAGLGAWAEALEAASAAGWERELSAGEEAQIARRRASVEAETAKVLKRDAFFLKRGGLIIGAAVVLLVVGFAVSDIARAQRDKPNFSGLPPLEVVRHYYEAMDGIDLDSLEACGERGAIKADMDVLTNLVVLTKTRMAYEGRSPILPAKGWIASGMKALKETDFLYGIVGLEIADVDSGDVVGPSADARRFRATYSLWSPDRVEDSSGDPGKVRSQPKEDKRVDELVLRQGKKGWRIVSLDRRHP